MLGLTHKVYDSQNIGNWDAKTFFCILATNAIYYCFYSFLLVLLGYLVTKELKYSEQTVLHIRMIVFNECI